MPDHFDGQYAFPGHGQRTVLVRNHEVWSDDPGSVGSVDAAPSFTYDPDARGGTTTVHVGPSGQLVEE